MNEPIAGAARAECEAMQADERRWRRRSLYALIVLLPLSIGVGGYEALYEWWTGRDRFAHEVPPADSADFGGSRWQLSKFRMLPIPTSAGPDIPEGAMGVLAEFEVLVQDPDLVTRWQGCAISLESPDGRRWAPTTALPLPRSEARNCYSTIYSSQAKAGSTVRVREVFFTPLDIADSVRATVTLQPQQPYYLRFQQAPERVEPKP